LLSVMVFEFSYTMRLEATVTRNFKEGANSYYLAQAGINRAVIEIVKTKSSVKKFKGSKESLVKDKEQDETGEEEESKEWRPREEPYAFPFGGGECEVKIGDEGSKINLNWVAKEAKKNRKLLTDILEKSCGLEGEKRDTIADSIIDWVDKDSAHLLNGAEDDYYESLEDPYECRDGNFVVTEELLLVRGVTEEIYYGKKPFSEEGDEFEEKVSTYSAGGEEWGNLGEERRITQGLSEIFTVFSSKTSHKININDASYGLLMSMQGMTDEVALRIIELRREEEFENINDVRLKTLPNYNQIASKITVDPTNFYRIEACGRVADSSVKRTITAVIELTMKKRNKYAIVYWQE
ncbi:MAG: general secretion pathway protein GspK, partial [Deltaproteobacteria bacterium]|nr:general secretion pathway protein GspK [Deltaproteobacteria bacterium]